MNKLKIAFVALLLAACSPSGNQEFYETLNKSKWNQITIQMHWLPSMAAVNEKCLSLGTKDGPDSAVKAYGACARSKPDDISICEIYAKEPDSFDDEKQLTNLGHEMWHCFGARHK